MENSKTDVDADVQLDWAHFVVTLTGIVGDCDGSRQQIFFTFDASNIEAPLSCIFLEEYVSWLFDITQRSRRTTLHLYGVSFAGSKSKRKIIFPRQGVTLPASWMPKHWDVAEAADGGGVQTRADTTAVAAKILERSDAPFPPSMEDTTPYGTDLVTRRMQADDTDINGKLHALFASIAAEATKTTVQRPQQLQRQLQERVLKLITKNFGVLPQNVQPKSALRLLRRQTVSNASLIQWVVF
jgi:hypothetical protein